MPTDDKEKENNLEELSYKQSGVNVDAGYERAIQIANERKLKIPV